MILRFLAVLTLLSFLTSQSFGQQADPILFSVEGNPVHVSEFDYIYNKNNGNKADYSEKNLKEYLDLYINFKLKVQKARDLRLDTLPTLKSELEGYRKQLSKNYLVDKEVSENLIREVFERQKTDKRIAHILFALPPDAPEQQTVETKKRATIIYQDLLKGSDFTSMAKSVSDDKSSAPNGGDIGFYTSMFPEGFYDLENAMYNLNVGEISKPVRTKVGVHIIKILEERPARGEINVGQVLIRTRRKGQPVVGAKEKAFKIYEDILAGTISFEEAARKFSDDRKTSVNGGKLGFFGINVYDKAFEDVAFGLENNGDISAPVETKIGWHIIKRIEKRDLNDFNKSKGRLSSKVSKAPRFDIAKRSFIEKIKIESDFTDDEAILTDLNNNIGSDFYTYKWQVPAIEDKLLFSFDNGLSANVSEFLKYCKKNSRIRLRYDKNKPTQEAISQLYNSFVDDYVLRYEESRLEEKYPEFKALMREYSEGIILFEATKRNVWDVASSDSVGLKKYFDQFKDNYFWKERAEVANYVINTLDQKIVDKIYKHSKKNSPEKTVSKFTRDDLKIDLTTNVYENGSKAMLGLRWKKNERSELEFNERRKHCTFRKIVRILPETQKSFEEARGYILADYQDKLEHNWVEKLKTEYSIEVNENVFQSLIK